MAAKKRFQKSHSASEKQPWAGSTALDGVRSRFTDPVKREDVGAPASSCSVGPTIQALNQM